MQQKRYILLSILLSIVSTCTVHAQCAMCTKTASQLGEGPAHGMNTAILYLMFAPLGIIAFIGFKWWKKEKQLSH